jgi:Glyoxalase-like domain
VLHHDVMRLDHLSYAAGPEGLAACVQRLGGRLGAAFSDGGLHPSFGTRNFVLPLAEGCYLEVVEALDHPAVDRAPFGRTVRDRGERGGGWLAWVVAVDDIAPVEHRLGRPGAAGHRRRPDGVDLRWVQIGVNDVAADPQLPFFVHWLSPPDEHPSASGSRVRLRRLEIAGDRATVEDYLGTSAADPLDGVTVDWVDPLGGDTGVVAVEFDTASGPVRID